MMKKINTLFFVAAFTAYTCGYASPDPAWECPADSLTAKHCVPALEGVLRDIEGSIAAFNAGKAITLKQERDEKFPDGDPQQEMNPLMTSLHEDRVSEEEARQKWPDLLQKKADWRSLTNKINFHQKIHDDILELVPNIVKLCLAIEDAPEAFTFPKTNEVPETVTAYDDSFPVKHTASWKLSDFSHTLKFFREYASTYALKGIEDFANKDYGEVTEVIKMCLQPLLPQTLDTEMIHQAIAKAKHTGLVKTYDIDDFCNAHFIVTKALFPLLDSWRLLKKEALKKKEADDSKPTAAGAAS